MAERQFTFRGYFALVALLPALCSCFSLTTQSRALVLLPDGSAQALRLTCPPTFPGVLDGERRPALDPLAIRVATWNIHKESDAGWEGDLTAIVRGSDIVLLQETTLLESFRNSLQGSELVWVMASSFTYDGSDVGVLSASRVAPIATCTERALEPILNLPKSAVISWYAMKERRDTLCVVNVHAINFTLSTALYRAQLNAVAGAIASHEGPMIVAGDFNTWSDARMQVMQDVADRLGLVEITLVDDKRQTFFGRQVDHILIRGLAVEHAVVIPVTSSDHNPILVTLRAD